MNVSWRHTLATGAALALASTASFAVAQSSAGHVVSVPGVTIGAPASSSGSGCCDAGKVHTINPPGVSVPGPNLVLTPGSAKVGSQYIVESGSTLDYNVSYQGADARTTFLSNGSYIPMADPIVPSTIDLGVAGSTQVTEVVEEQVPYQEQVCEERVVQTFSPAPVQAVCLDDTGTPHPASRVDDAERVNASYTGEVFRCMAGTSMQVNIGEVINGQANFTHSSGFSCAKGEALAHQPGGKLVCAPQVPQRNCNERSLLRRYGPGIKLIETAMSKKVCEPVVKTQFKTVQREVVREVPLPSAPMMLDGGVGQSVTY